MACSRSLKDYIMLNYVPGLVQGCGLAYGTKEGRLRVLTHSSRPLLASKKLEGQGRFEDELLAAAHEAYSHTSEEEG